MLALDVTRLEAGLVLIEVDYTSAVHSHIPAQNFSPYEIGMGRLVDLAKADYVGKRALVAEVANGGPARRLVGLDIAWTEIEALYAAEGLAPYAPPTVSRAHVPLHAGGRQVGTRHEHRLEPAPQEDDRPGLRRRRPRPDREPRPGRVDRGGEAEARLGDGRGPALLRPAAQARVAGRPNRTRTAPKRRQEETRVAERYDAVIIGGGHNGLTTAAYLAKAGWKTLVLEKRHILGGATTSDEIVPGYTFSVLSYVVSLLRPEIIRELELPKHGLEILPLDGTYTAVPGDYLWRRDDHAATMREIRRWSKSDADAYEEYGQLMADMARFIKPILGLVPPDPTSIDPRDWLGVMGLARDFARLPERQQAAFIGLMTMSAADFLDQWFETDPLKATMSASGIIGTFLGVRSPGTAYVLLHHYMGEIDGAFRAWGLHKGGTGAISLRHRQRRARPRRRDPHGRRRGPGEALLLGRPGDRRRPRERRGDRRRASSSRRPTSGAPSSSSWSRASCPRTSRPRCAASSSGGAPARSTSPSTRCRPSPPTRAGPSTCAGR